MTTRDQRGKRTGTRLGVWPSRNDPPPRSKRPVIVPFLLILLACAMFAAGCTSAPTTIEPSPATTITTGSPAATTAITTQNAAPQISQPPAPEPILTTMATLSITAEPATTRTATTVMTTAPASARPATGTLIAGKRLLGGYGKLRIDNINGSDDIVAVLTRWHSTTPLFGVYVRSGDTATNENVKDGMYDLYILAGQNWDAGRNMFDDDVVYLKVKSPLTFTSPAKVNVTAFPADETDSQTVPVQESSFPDL